MAEFDLARYNRRTAYIALIAFTELVALGYVWFQRKGANGDELAPPPIVDARLSRVPPPPPSGMSRPRAPAPPPSEEIATITVTVPAASGAPRASTNARASAPSSAPSASAASPAPAVPPAPSTAMAAAPPPDSRADEEPVAEYRPSSRADALLGIAPASDPGAPSDQTSPARLGANIEWHCPWPSSADAARIDHASVRLRAQVRADGQATSVAVLNDPGLGFGDQARSCAMGHVFVPARDKNGSPTAGSTLPFVVQFDRFQMITK